MTILKADTKITKSDKRQMNRIRKWKLSTEDDRITEDLSKLLKLQGDKVLNGNITLCLTSQVLASLNRQFHQLTEGASYQTFQVANEGHEGDNIAFIFDFLQKVPKLKVTSGPVCSPSPLLTLSYFKLVCHLEIKKIPICYLKGLTQLRRQLKSLTCSRSTNDIKTVVYQFGKEGSNLFALTELEILDLSYNTIRSLDDSLRLVPSLKKLNLSHNSLTACDLELAPSINYLNLGYNNISQIPACSTLASTHLSTLILRNNNLCALQGVQNYGALKHLDVSGNCIVSFDDLVPLAQLPRLVNLNLEGNPLGFMLDYRINTIARLCPVARREPVYLDGKALSAMEELCLGRDVEPVPLSAYIPSQPIGRPSGSLRELAKSLHELSRSDSNPSNSVILHTPAKTVLKKRSRKFREAIIIDASTPNTAPAERSENTTSSQERLFSASSGPIASRRSEMDNSVLWVHPGRDSEETGGLETLDYASYDESSSIADDTLDANDDFDPAEVSDLGDDLVPPRSKSYSTLTVNDYDIDKTDDRYSPSLSSDRSSSRHGEQGIYSSAPVRLNSMMSLEDESLHSIDNFSDDEDEELYLVQSVVANAKDRYGREEKESIFLVIRQPDIIERDPFNSKTLHRLDLNYLQDMTFHTLDPLRVNLRFSLLRQDRKERVYIFEDPDNMNSFIEVLKPIVKVNQDREFAKMLHYQCLRCYTEFAGSREQESRANCPTCGSTLVVEREDRHLPNGDVADGLLLGSLNTTEGESQHSEGAESRNSPALANNHPLAIVVPFASHENTKTGSLPTSFYIKEREVNEVGESCESECPRTTQSVPKAYTLSMEVRPEIPSDRISFGGSQISSSLRSYSSSEGSALSLLSKKTQCSDSCGERDLVTGSRCSSRLETESRASDTVECSRTSTPLSPTSVSTTSSKSRGNHLEQASTEGSLFNKDEFKKLHHRIMLFLCLNVLKDDLDSFYCSLRTSCVSAGKQEEIECLLVVSALHVIILKVDENEREVSENMLQSVARHNLGDLKCIDYGYFNQSFRLDFSGNPASYKFLVRDTLRCERFLATLLCELENSDTLQEPPQVLEEPNPQTIANLRCELFDEKEDLQSLGRRLFVQATSFSSPPTLKVRKIRMRSHDYSFTAREFIDWLVARRFVKSKTEGVDLLQRLAGATVIQSVGKDSHVAYTDAVFKFPHAGSPKQPIESQSPERTSGDDTRSLDSYLEDEDDYSVMRYHLLFVGIERRDSCLIPRTLVMTKTHLYLADECHQWPLSRFLCPPQHLEDQFLKVDVQQITNATKMEFYNQDPFCMRISFVDECCDDGPSESSWIVKSETARSLSEVSTAIREHWKKQFTIDLPCSQLPQLRSSLL